MAQSDIKITFEDLKTTKNIRQQMAQFGQTNPTRRSSGIVASFLIKTK
jgi:trigger factor